MVRYAAVLYGIDPSQLPVPGRDRNGEPDDTRASRTPDPASKTPVPPDLLLGARSAVLQQSRGKVQEQVRDLKTKRNRYEIVKKSFEELLGKLESEINATALTEVRSTLEVMQPKQAKDLILRMLEEDDFDPQDRVMDDVVEIVTTMSPAKLKKIFGEFKTESEREKLHQVFVTIGQLMEDQPTELAP
jgi:hypothetical protein